MSNNSLTIMLFMFHDYNYRPKAGDLCALNESDPLWGASLIGPR